jgi:hypothetical protein
VQRSFDVIRSGDSKTCLGELLMGAGSAAEMALSPLALYDCQDAFAAGEGWNNVIDPPLRRNVKSQVHMILNSKMGEIVQNTAPSPRFLQRENSRDSDMRCALIANAHDISGEKVSTLNLRNIIQESAKLITISKYYRDVVRQIIDRTRKKNRMVVSSKKKSDGTSETVGSRGNGISLLKENHEWVSAQILFYSESGHIPKDSLSPVLSKLFDLHILFPSSAESENCLDEFVVVCRSSKNEGKFMPQTWEKRSVQHELLLVFFLF